MVKYYCPYCNPKYQFSIENNGKLVCGLCGENLIKKKIIEFKQLIALLLVFSFSFPLVFIVFSSVINTGKDKKENFAFTYPSIRNYKKLLPPN
tara:strand:+ start:53 stop:331 length:279 start_codon:yes stop_codon:yes gene_type:complete